MDRFRHLSEAGPTERNLYTILKPDAVVRRSGRIAALLELDGASGFSYEVATAGDQGGVPGATPARSPATTAGG